MRSFVVVFVLSLAIVATSCGRLGYDYLSASDQGTESVSGGTGGASVDASTLGAAVAARAMLEAARRRSTGPGKRSAGRPVRTTFTGAAPLSCGTTQGIEALNLVQPGATGGGVLCCRD